MRVIALGDRNPEFLTHRELDSALALFPEACPWIGTDDPAARDLDGVDGVWLVPGSPYRDDAVAYAAIAHCVDTGTPFLGTCAGFQYAAVALARTLLALPTAGHLETEPEATEHVIVGLSCTLYGERRTVTPVPGTRLASICGVTPFEGFHFCGYGLAGPYAERLERAGVVISAHAPDAGPEALELPGQPFFLATAFQPQVGSSESGVLHPLIKAWLAAAGVHAGLG